MPSSGSILQFNKIQCEFDGFLLAAHLIGYGDQEFVNSRGHFLNLKKHGIECKEVKKISEGFNEIIELIRKGEVSAIINTPMRKNEIEDAKKIRWNAILYSIPCFTTISEAGIFFEAIKREKNIKVFKPLQSLK